MLVVVTLRTVAQYRVQHYGHEQGQHGEDEEFKPQAGSEGGYNITSRLFQCRLLSFLFGNAYEATSGPPSDRPLRVLF